MNAPAGDDHEPDQDWGADATRRDGKFVAGWPPFPFTVPFDWPSGAYIAMFVQGDGKGQPDPNQDPPIDFKTARGDAGSAKAMFVVKNPTPGVASQVLYKLPLFTYHAYNSSVYTGIDGQPHGGDAYQGYWVTLRRPGGGTGGTPWDVVRFIPPNLDVFDMDSYRQTFVHWDAKFISWVESEGFRIDYCTDLDIHLDDDLSLLSPYALVLSVGHDEYYSIAMRDHLEAYISNGGNVAFFCGNTCYVQMQFPVRNNLTQIARGPYAWIQKKSMDYPDAPDKPEDSLTGVGFRHGGERNFPTGQNPNERVGYTVQHTETWPFEDTIGLGLAENQPFGEKDCIVGYECDGTPYNHNSARPVSPSFNPEDHTPDGFIILGTGETSPWGSNGAATMGMYTKSLASGTVFTAATTDWARVVWQGEPQAVQITRQITRNVMNRLGGNPKGLAELRNIANLICCDGFFSGDDNFRHAVVGTSDGNITEIPFSPVIGQPQGATAFLNGLLDLGAFYSVGDQLRHIVAVDFDGNVWDTAWNTNNSPRRRIIAKIPNAFRISGFAADNDLMYAIVATSDGNVFGVSYTDGSLNPQTASLGTFQNIVDVGSFFSPDDGYRHAIVGTADGTVTEIFFSLDLRVSQSGIAKILDLAKVSAYYAGGDHFFRRRVQVLTGGGRIHEVRYHPDFGIMHAVLFNPGPLVDLGGFFTDDDNFRHAILVTTGGDVQELFFNP
jgi:hypothetical protein